MDRRKLLLFATLLAWSSVGIRHGYAVPLEPQADKAAEKAAEKAAVPKSADEPAESKTAESKTAEAPHAPAENHSAAKAATAKTAQVEKESPAKDGHAAGDHVGTAQATHAESGSGHGSGGHHGDPTDVGHQNAGPKLEDPSQWKADLAICTLIVFLCLLALLTKFAWRPVMEGLEARERGIAASIDEARRSSEKAAEQLRQYEARLAAATEETRAILDQARRDAEAAKDRIVAEAQEVAQRERQRAVDDITAAKNVALQEITQKSVDLAVNLAGKLIRQQLRPDDHSKLIREMIEQFPSRN